MEKKVRFIAIYLPQYYPIPENDETWGRGFTEWTNVAKAKPLFKGHYQPRIPADLGFYDLRVPETRIAQAEMARNAGIEGFMYWHYWFGNGRRLLERPFNEVLETRQPDFPFCLGWANHSWTTRTWTTTGQFQSNKMIAEQLYPGVEDYTKHFYAVLPAFRDKRYITVDGKPFFLIYDPMASSEIGLFLNTWRNLAKENGLEGIHFVGLASGDITKFQKVMNVGFDAIAPSYLWHAESMCKGRYNKLIWHKLRDKLQILSPLDKYEYKDIIKYLSTDLDQEEYVYPSAIPQWDRSPRSGRQAVIYHGSTPELFETHLKELICKVQKKNDDHRIILLRSWNEWGEGNYFEPDRQFGNQYLDVVGKYAF